MRWVILTIFGPCTKEDMSKIAICFCLIFYGVSHAQVVDITFEGPNGDQAVLVENCDSDTAYIVIAPRANSPEVFQSTFEFFGSAQVAEDFSSEVPLTPGFGPMTEPYRIPISVLNDDIIEGEEEIIFRVLSLGDRNVIGEISIAILDALTISIEGPDTLQVCQDAPVDLVATSNLDDITWTYGDMQATGTELSISPQEDLTVIASVVSGTCEVSDTVEIELLAGATFDHEDTVFVCLPTTVDLSVTTIGQQGELVWSPMDSTIEIAPGGNSATITTDQTRTYIIQLTTADCVVGDTVVVRVDSLPESMPITNIPAKDSYCPGETVSLFSRYLGPIDFPDAEYQWIFDAGSPLSDQDLENFVFSTQDTSVFRRTTTNNACEVTDTILINVVRPPVELNITDTTVCPNQRVQIILLTADELDSFEWMPEEGLSCTDCEDPVAQTPSSMSWTVTGMKDDCPASASVNVNIEPPTTLTIIPDTIVCSGSDVQLTILDPMEFGDFRWSGTGLTCTNCGVPTAENVTQTSTYTVIGESSDGCLAEGSGIVQVFPDTDAAINASPEIDLSINGLGAGTIVTLSTIEGGSPYIWTRNGESIEGSEASVTAVIRGGDNSFRVEFTSANGCPVVATLDITGVQPTWDLPNAFTPGANNDPPTNERFRVVQLTGMVEVVELKVFNRWGQIVYDGNNSEGWDGNHSGKRAPSEVYAYTATVRYPDGEIEMRRGEVTLIR